jgi:DNA-binding NarL/FixJ family response regulator
MMKEKITLSVYDENRLQKELLHHQLERTGFHVLYSTTRAEDLIEYFEQRPSTILLVSGQNHFSKFISIVKKLRKHKGKLKVLFYNLEVEDAVFDIMNAIRGISCESVSDGWVELLNKIEAFYESKARSIGKGSEVHMHFASKHPFSKISGNKKHLDILRYLKEGKSNRQIAYLTHTSIDSVKYCIKKMHDETGSNTTKMVADAMKAGLI